MRTLCVVCLCGTTGLHAGVAAAEQPAPNGAVHASSSAEVAVGGYVEAFYQWNFNDPSNGLTNFRGFDNRHNSFTLANAVLDATGNAEPASARLAVQFGHTPETYYLAEPTSLGASGAATTGSSSWKFLQQANVGYRAPVGRGLLVEGGLFLSPIGPEGMAVKDQWNWSRSNPFFGLPFYHTGVRLSYPMTDRLSFMLMGSNGWNSVVDNNSGKSVAAEVLYTVSDEVTAHVLYFGGIERSTGAPEGSPWRHLVDVYVTAYPVSWLAVNVHGDAGMEENAFGTSSWTAGALSARFEAQSWIALAGRADLFHETVAENATGRAGSIFWPAAWVASQTLTLDLRPHENVSARLEYRHDYADEPMFFRGDVATDISGAFLMDARTQDTVTLGMTTWF